MGSILFPINLMSDININVIAIAISHIISNLRYIIVYSIDISNPLSFNRLLKYPRSYRPL